MSPRHTHYDMIFLGGGCAALSLLVRLLQSGKFSKSRFLVVDRDSKKSNDRTWCFWEKGAGYFESVVHRQWGQLDFFSSDFSSPLRMEDYRYKMIRGIDFYAYCLEVIERSGQVEWVQASLTDVSNADGHVTLQGFVGSDALGFSNPSFLWNLNASLVFNSIYRPATASTRQVDLLQHFKGWVIETPVDTFDPQCATLMDFRVGQQEGTTFVYVMPFSERRALVEYTLFTEQLLSPVAYEQGLRGYIETQLGVKQYTITEEEFGIIPMTTRSFQFYQDGIFNLGTAGGQTKASSGYTFQFIQKQSERILQQLVEQVVNQSGQQSVMGKALRTLKADASRFHFYDRVLLHVLAKNYWPGDKVFARLFERNKASQIFRFLDNETTLTEELSIIGSLPTWPFLKGAASAI